MFWYGAGAGVLACKTTKVRFDVFIVFTGLMFLVVPCGVITRQDLVCTKAWCLLLSVT